MKPLVSILIPAYNAEAWIADTIKSALAQTWPRKEIIVVDDGSTDRTLSIADKFSSPEVFVTFQKNSGAAAARNKAFSICKGDYIQWLDADDLLAPDKIQKQMEVAERIDNKRVLFSSEWGRFIFRTRRAKFVPTALWDDLSPVEWLLRKMGRNIWMQPGTWLVSRELTQAAGPWDERLSFDDDGEYFCRVLLESDGVKFVRDAKTFYRASGSASLSNMNFSTKKSDSSWLSIRLHIQYLRWLEDSPRTRRACLAYLQEWLPCFHPHRPDIIAQAQDLASVLGGRLNSPRLRRKYAWLEIFFGYSTAARAQEFFPGLKTSLMRFWDKALFNVEKVASF
jgi:glycosyltransferase involved in cell wall biosynthesis